MFYRLRCLFFFSNFLDEDMGIGEGDELRVDTGDLFCFVLFYFIIYFFIGN